jgi:hypothetical protein
MQRTSGSLATEPAFSTVAEGYTEASQGCPLVKMREALWHFVTRCFCVPRFEVRQRKSPVQGRAFIEVERTTHQLMSKYRTVTL